MKLVILFIVFQLLAIVIFAQTKAADIDTLKSLYIPTDLTPVKIENGKKKEVKDDTLFASGQNSKKLYEDFFDQLAKLPEFKQEKDRIAFINKATNSNLTLHVDYLETPYMDNDKGLRFSVTTLFETQPGQEPVKLFTIMFDKTKGEIYSVEDHLRRTKRLKNFTIDWKLLGEKQL